MFIQDYSGMFVRFVGRAAGLPHWMETPPFDGYRKVLRSDALGQYSGPPEMVYVLSRTPYDDYYGDEIIPTQLLRR